jgi:hypothetical protein
MRLRKLLGNLHQLSTHHTQSLALEPSENLPHQPALNRIRFKDNQRRFHHFSLKINPTFFIGAASAILVGVTKAPTL